MLDDLSFQMHLFDSAGMDDPREFIKGRFDQNNDPRDLDAAAGATRAGADKHQQDQNRLGKGGEKIKIGGGKAGGGDNTADLE